MPRRPTPSRRLVTAALWPFGVGLTSWHYMWRTTALHRREVPGSAERDGPPALPSQVSPADVQGSDDGVGPLFHRRYRARIVAARLSPEELMGLISADPNRVAPTEFAKFAKIEGDPDHMRVGDEFVVRMPGPWNGPVRVVSRTDTSFRLATLRGHLEAGQIEFRASADAELTFAIESWARSGDRLSNLMYQQLRMAKEVQLHMWTSFLERVARLSGGRMTGGIDIDTRRVDDGADDPGRWLGDPAAKRVLDELHDRGLNFDADDGDRFTPEEGWKVDDYRRALPSEAPGPPQPGGSWETAARLLRDYEFADPAMVRAVYHPDRPLDERDMLLEARFVGLRFHLGVRVGGLIDETRELSGRPVRVWGWNYRTLQGHLEMGQMDFEVWKWLEDGRVDFHIRAVSRRAPVGNPVVRVGLRLFGRAQQVKFARRACQRMAELTIAAADRPAEPRTFAPAASEVTVSPR